MRRAHVLIVLLVGLGLTGGVIAVLARDGTDKSSRSSTKGTPRDAFSAAASPTPVDAAGERRFVGYGETLVDLTSARMRAEFNASGLPTRVYTGRSVSGSYECLIYEDHRGFGASCDPNLLAASKVAYLDSFDGGPDPQTMSNRHIAGVVDSAVEQLVVVNARGISRPVPITEDRAFLYVVPRAELRAAIEPAELVAFDRSGRIIERVPLS